MPFSVKCCSDFLLAPRWIILIVFTVHIAGRRPWSPPPITSYVAVTQALAVSLLRILFGRYVLYRAHADFHGRPSFHYDPWVKCN